MANGKKKPMIMAKVVYMDCTCTGGNHVPKTAAPMATIQLGGGRSSTRIMPSCPACCHTPNVVHGPLVNVAPGECM